MDDIVGSGLTLDTVRDALRTRGVEQVHTATLCRYAGSTITPDLWIWTVRDWVVFPWETPDLPRTSTLLPYPDTVTRP